LGGRKCSEDFADCDAAALRKPRRLSRQRGEDQRLGNSKWQTRLLTGITPVTEGE
jgi:hypothetical protein